MAMLVPAGYCKQCGKQAFKLDPWGGEGGAPIKYDCNCHRTVTRKGHGRRKTRALSELEMAAQQEKAYAYFRRFGVDPGDAHSLAVESRNKVAWKAWCERQLSAQIKQPSLFGDEE